MDSSRLNHHSGNRQVNLLKPCVISLITTKLIFKKNLHFAHTAFTCFVHTPEKTATFAVYKINRLLFYMYRVDQKKVHIR